MLPNPQKCYLYSRGIYKEENIYEVNFEETSLRPWHSLRVFRRFDECFPKKALDKSSLRCYNMVVYLCFYHVQIFEVEV